MNLQRRVTVALAALVTVFVTVQGGLAYLSLAEQEDDLVDELVMREARALAARAERGDIQRPGGVDLLAPSHNLSAWLVDAGGTALPGAVPAHLVGLRDGPHRLGRPDQELHVVVLPTGAGKLYVQYDAEQNEAKVREFGYYLIGLVSICIALGLVLSWRVAAWVVAPIERLTARLSNWAPEAQSADAATTDEESRLLGAFGRVQNRFEQAIAHEREFVANVGHEIRTPLAALRTDLEMLEPTLQPDSSNRGRLQRALTAVDTIASSLASARSLSRQQSRELQEVDLSRCVDDAWESLEPLDGIDRIDFANEVPAGSKVTADRHSLLTILRNLMRNAVEHAAPGRCIVRQTARGIEVVDDGPGISAQDVPHVFDRYYRGRLVDSPGGEASGERGLGLAIARQIADLNGWTLTVGSADPSGAAGAARGTCFILSLGDAAAGRI